MKQMHSDLTNIDRTDVGELLARYLIGLDADPLDDDWAGGLFTADAIVEFPMSAHRGLAGMAGYHREALGNFAATQHLGSPPVVQVAGDRAGLRANLTSTHVHHATREGGPPEFFRTGTLVDGDAVRTDAGWRLSRLSFRVQWMDGRPPAGSS
jgi:hypothetical protein